MTMDPLITSALISGGSNLIYGLLGGNKGPSWKDQWASFENQQEMEVKAFKQKMKLADFYKIHPLTMLGAQLPQVSSPVYSGGGGSNMGQNVVRSLAKGASDYFTGKANEKMNALALERAQLENDLLRSQISSINTPQKAGSAYSNDQRVLNVPDENLARTRSDYGLSAASDIAPPIGKRYTVGDTPYGKVYITLPASGQADDFGEVYGAIKGLEYLGKRGYVHYMNGSYRSTKSLREMVSGQFKPRPNYTKVPSFKPRPNYTKVPSRRSPSSKSTKKNYSKITW